MTRSTILTFAILALAAAVPAVQAAPVIVVAPLNDASPAPDPDTVQGVTDLLSTVLADRVVVVNRARLDAVLQEQRLTARGLADPAAAARIGKILQADYILIGSVFRQKDKIEFALQLMRVNTAEVAGAISANGAPDKLLDLANDLAAQCAAALKVAPPAAGTDAAADHAAAGAAEQYFLEALAYYHAGNYDHAIADCLKVIQLDPNNQRARLRLAESFLAAGDVVQAGITLNRTLQLFPDAARSDRVSALLDRVDPLPLQAVAGQPLVVRLPDAWPADQAVAWVLSWSDQVVRGQVDKATDRSISVPMPDARIPLSLSLQLEVGPADHRQFATREVRLWPADVDIKLPSARKVVTADGDSQFESLIDKLPHKRFNSCQSIPEPDVRFVVAPAAAARIDAAQARALTDFVAAGGELVIIGPAPADTEIAGVRTALVRVTDGSNAAAWTTAARAPILSYLPTADLVATLARKPEVILLRGGRPWLHTAPADVPAPMPPSASTDQSAVPATPPSVLIAESAVGKGRLLWIAWPTDWASTDPRAARILALALGDFIALPEPPSR